jgi:hypothetical protein
MVFTYVIGSLVSDRNSLDNRLNIRKTSMTQQFIYRNLIVAMAITVSVGCSGSPGEQVIEKLQIAISTGDTVKIRDLLAAKSIRDFEHYFGMDKADTAMIIHMQAFPRTPKIVSEREVRGDLVIVVEEVGELIFIMEDDRRKLHLGHSVDMFAWVAWALQDEITDGDVPPVIVEMPEHLPEEWGSIRGLSRKPAELTPKAGGDSP